MLLLLMAGCAPTWDRVEDCEGISSTETRDQCYSETVVELFRTDVDAGEAIVELVSDPLTRDYIWYRVTRDVFPEDYRYCERIEMEELQGRCKVIVSRPHLRREIRGGGEEGAGGGSRPPRPSGATGSEVAPPMGPGAGPPGGPQGGPGGMRGPGGGKAPGEGPPMGPDGQPPEDGKILMGPDGQPLPPSRPPAPPH